METNSFFAIIQIALLTVQQLFWSVVSDEGQTAQFVPLVCNNVAICGSSRPFYSLSVLSLTTCTTECYFNLYQSAPCVGFNYRSTNQTCDIFTKDPIFFANDIQGCQYYQDARDANSSCTALPGLGSVTLLASLGGPASVLAIALLKEQLFVTRSGSATVSVYNSTSLQFLNSFTFSSFQTWLAGMTTNANNNILFISDWHNQCVHKVSFSPFSPTVSTMKWNVMSNPWGLSLTNNGNVLVVFGNQVISEYTPNGTLVRQISDVNQLWHAVQVNNVVWAYVVKHPLHGVCTAFTNGTVIKCYGSTAGSAITQMSSPRNLALDARGYIFVSDHGNNRILIVNPSLTEARQLTLPVSTALQFPLALLLSPSLNRLYIGEDSGSFRILLFDIK